MGTNYFLPDRGLNIEQNVLVLFCAFLLTINDKNIQYVSLTDTFILKIIIMIKKLKVKKSTKKSNDRPKFNYFIFRLN